MQSISRVCIVLVLAELVDQDFLDGIRSPYAGETRFVSAILQASVMARRHPLHALQDLRPLIACGRVSGEPAMRRVVMGMIAPR